MSTSTTPVSLESALPQTYQQLCRLACSYLAHQPAASRLQPATAVHETVLLLLRQRCREWHDLSHFLGTAATLLRRVIVDHRRGRRTAKRGGFARPVAVEESCATVSPRSEEAVALEQALALLERRDPRQGQVVRLRFLAGMTVEETAAALSIAPATVRRDWAAARRWLRRKLTEPLPRRLRR